MSLTIDDLRDSVLDTNIHGIPTTFRPIKVIAPVKGVTPVTPIQKPAPVVVSQPSTGGQNGVPLPLLNVSATQTPIKQQSYTNSLVTITWTQRIDPNVDHVNIWLVGYHGSQNPLLIASGNKAPINFIVDATKETVTVYAQTVSSAGASAPQSLGAQTTVALSGVVSNPPPPTVTTNLVASSTGYQFAFAYEAGLLQDVIQSYNIYRNTSNTTVGATIRKNVPQPSTNTGSYVYQEDTTPGTVYFYWVTAVNTSGLESTKAAAQSGAVVSGALPNLGGNDGVLPTQAGLNLVFNGDFSTSTTPTGTQSLYASAIRAQDPQTGGGALQPSANGWTRNFLNGLNGEGYIYQLSSPASQGLASPFCLVMQDTTNGGGDDFAAVCDAFPVRALTQYNFSANLNIGYGTGLPAHAAWYFRVIWYQVGTTDFSWTSPTLISAVDIVSGSTASGAQAVSGNLTAPSNAGFCRILVFHWSDGLGTPASVWNLLISNVRCVPTLDDAHNGTSNYTQTPSGTSYKPLSNMLTATDAGANATISLAAFTLRVSNIGDISYNSGSITGLSYKTLYYVYTDDATLAGGGATYQATTTKETALTGSGRIFLGQIITPAATAPNTSGLGTGGVGAQYSQSGIFGFSSTQTVILTNCTSGTVANAYDGDYNSFDALASTAASGAASGQLIYSGAAPTTAAWSSVNLKLLNQVVTNPAGCTAQLEYSLDNGVTYTTVYNLSATTRAKTIDTISVPIAQNLALIKIRLTISRASGTSIVQVNMYEMWVEAVQ
jgi:hypothetical protein